MFGMITEIWDKRNSDPPTMLDHFLTIGLLLIPMLSYWAIKSLILAI